MIHGSGMEEDPVLAEETQRRGRLVLHTLPILLIPVFTAAVAYVLVRLTGSPAVAANMPAARANPVSAIIVMAVFLTALIVLVRVGRPTVSALLLIGVWTLITTLATLRGGINNIGPAFLIIPICAAGLLIDGVASMSLAALATVLVGSLAWLQMSGFYVPSAPELPLAVLSLSPLSPPIFFALVWTGIFWTVALLTSLLAGGLQRALEQSRQQAQALQTLSNQLEARVAAQTAELAQRAARAEALYDVSQALTNTLDLDQILTLISEQTARLLGFDAAQVLLERPDGSFAPLGIYPHVTAGVGGCLGNDLGTLAPDVPDARAAVIHEENDHDGAQTGDDSGASGGQTFATGATGRTSPTRGLATILREVGEHREPRIVRLSGCESGSAINGGAALMLPMHFRSQFTGVLMLTNASGDNACGSDDLILGQGLADQAAVAIVNAQLLSEAREAATLEERTRLARDIHDTLAQGLTGVVVQLGAAQRALNVAPDEAREHLALATQMARESLAEARRSVWNLRAAALERGDLGQALQALAVRPLGAPVSVTFEQRGAPWPLSSAIESTLLRVCQEALINVAKHAQATQARIVLDYRPDSVQLSIQDNGVGFDPQVTDQAAALPGPWGGFGLVGMRERVEALRGTLQISGEEGARILAVVPRDEITRAAQAVEPQAALRQPSPKEEATR
jgi:signal transduction histidine kinase